MSSPRRPGSESVKIRVLLVDMGEFLNRRSGRQITPAEERIGEVRRTSWDKQKEAEATSNNLSIPLSGSFGSP